MVNYTKNEIVITSSSAEFNNLIDHSELHTKFQFTNFNSSLSTLNYLKNCIYPEFVLIYENLPSIDGIEIIKKIEGNGIKHRYIIVSSINSTKRAVDAIKFGADDYIVNQDHSEPKLLELIDKVWGIPLNSKKSKKDKEKEQFERILLTRLSISELSLTQSLNELIQIVIDESEQLTNSSIGFFHFLSKDQKTLTLQTWSSNTLQKMCSAEGKESHYPVENGGVWAECIQVRKPVIHNDYSSLPNKKGLPEGHAKVIRELVLPIFEGESIVAILGVGNKEVDYDESDINSLNQLSHYAWDIIKNKRTEEALRESEERYRYMFENNPQPMFIYDLESLNFVQVNVAFIEHLGYSKEELLKMTLLDIHLKEDIEAVKQDIEKTKRFNNPTGVWRNVKKNGEIIYIDIVAHTVFYNNRVARHILVRDITESKLAKEALIESESQFRLLFNISPDALFLLNEKGQFIDANQVAIKRYNYSLDEFLKMSPLDLAPTTLKEKVPERVSSAVKDEIHFEWIHCTKEGKEFPVEIHTKPTTLKGKKAVFVEARDITERKLAEEKLFNAANQWQITFDTVQDGVCLLDKDQRIIRCNQVMIDFFPNNGKSMIGKYCWEVIHDSSKVLEECPINIMRKSLKRESIELKINDKWFDITVDPIFDAENNYSGAVHIIRNITERKKAEEKLLELNNQLKSINATKDKLFSIIAHDLKSPFNSILGFSDLLINNIHNYSDEKIDEFVSQINTSAKSTLSLIDNLLLWANTQMGHIEYTPEKIDLLTVVQKIVEQLKITAKIKNISISFFQTEDFLVRADKNMLEIILRNLLSNAIKFTNPNGKIAIYAISTNNGIEVTVSDNGVGICKEIIDKLFSESENITTKGTANEKGSGLGLMLSKEFVEKLGGKIWVESEVGVGSEFKFTLPKF